MLTQLKHKLYKGFQFLRFRLHFLLHGKQARKNIALVVRSFDKGGLEQVVLNLYLGYKKRGYNAYILSETREVGQMAEKLLDLRDVYIFDGNEETFINFCRKKDIGVLHYHYNTYMMAGARKMGFHILYTMHNVYTWMSTPEICAYSGKLARAHKIIPVSSFVKNYYLARTHVASENVQVIQNGIDFAELECTDGDLPVTRASLGLDKKDITVAQIASFHHVKHQTGMIGVMERLVKTHPHIKLLLVGNVGDPNFYKIFLREWERSPAKKNILLVPYFDHKYMGRFLRETVDIFTLPTLQEGCSNAVLEAIYCAKPMVLTDVGNARDVENKTACEVVPTAYEDVVKLTQPMVLQLAEQTENRNTEALADAIAKVADALPAYEQKARAAAEDSAQYSTDAMVDAYVRVLESL